MEAKEPDVNAIYSYADYLTWEIQERYELIKGKVFRMSPAPAPRHQVISHRLSGELYVQLKGKKCQTYPAPFDVRLPKKSKNDKDIFTVLQPDLCVICDPNKLDKRGCIGAPDIVVEILSPGNNRTELKNKYEAYEEAGVKEYWVIHPEEKTFFKYILNNKGKFEATRLLTLDDLVTTEILPDFILDLTSLFED